MAIEGWTILQAPADPDVTERMREAILRLADGRPGRNMLLHQDPVFVQAVLNEKFMAMAEYSVGRGFLLSRVAAGVRSKGAPSMSYTPTKLAACTFPAHNMLLTACWVCDEYS